MLTKEYANCRVTIDDKNVLTAVIDLNKNVGLSSTTKSINVGTTNGNNKIPHKDQILNLGINCYVKNPKYVITEKDKAHYKEIYTK